MLKWKGFSYKISIFMWDFTSDGSEPRLGSDLGSARIWSKKLGSARLVRFFKKLVLKKIGKTSLEFHVTLFDQAKAANEF